MSKVTAEKNNLWKRWLFVRMFWNRTNVEKRFPRKNILRTRWNGKEKWLIYRKPLCVLCATCFCWFGTATVTNITSVNVTALFFRGKVIREQRRNAAAATRAFDYSRKNGSVRQRIVAKLSRQEDQRKGWAISLVDSGCVSRWSCWHIRTEAAFMVVMRIVLRYL